ALVLTLFLALRAAVRFGDSGFAGGAASAAWICGAACCVMGSPGRLAIEVVTPEPPPEAAAAALISSIGRSFNSHCGLGALGATDTSCSTSAKQSICTRNFQIPSARSAKEYAPC